MSDATYLWNLLTDVDVKNIGNSDIRQKAETCGKKLSEWAKDLNLPKTWTREGAYDLEVKKGVLRSLLRFSSESTELNRSIMRSFSSNLKNAKDASESKYFTQLYPIIHLADDGNEAGGMHLDQVGRKRLHTIWTPIVDYKYAALSYIKSGWIFQRLAPSTLKILEKVFRRNLNAHTGDSYKWGGGFLHVGNRNSSNDISSALVLRVTEEPIHYEPVHLTSQFDNLSNGQNTPPAKQVLDDVAKAVAFSNAVGSPPILDLIAACKRFVFETWKTPNIHLSFALTLVSQRIRTVPDVFSNGGTGSSAGATPVWVPLDIISLLSGCANLVCVENVLKFAGDKDRAAIIAALREADQFGVLPDKTFQWQIVTGGESPQSQPAWLF